MNDRAGLGRNVDDRTVMTFTGRWVDPLALRPEDVALEDIVHALSHQCRFSGHTRIFYSVAEHCARVAAQMANDGHTYDDCLWGLLHDAPEAYLVDLPRPVKHDPEIGDAFKAVENRVMGAIIEAFGLIPFEPEAIKHYDLMLLATEWRDLMHPTGVLDCPVDPIPGKIMPLSPGQARREFTSLFAAFAGNDQLRRVS